MTTLNSFFSPASQFIQPKKHFHLSISPAYHISTISKRFLNPNLVTKPFRPTNAVTEDRELAPTDKPGDEDEENASISTEIEGIKNSMFGITSPDRLLNAAIVLGAGSLALTRLLTIDHDYWHGWTLFEVLRYAPEHNWNAYEETLKTHPVLAKMAISGVVYSLGDWIAQALFPSKDWWVVLGKVAFDQSVWAAIWNSIYYVVLGFLRLESPIKIVDELKSTFWPMLTNAIYSLKMYQCTISSILLRTMGNDFLMFNVSLCWLEALAFCSFNYLRSDSSGAKTSMGGLYSNEKSEVRISEASESQPGSPSDNSPESCILPLTVNDGVIKQTCSKDFTPPNWKKNQKKGPGLFYFLFFGELRMTQALRLAVRRGLTRNTSLHNVKLFS
ncbi:hypothetical protein DH2020_022680 [Rehmannia glutinosa]|uniref:Peroxisomal membrane protein n=1 Tax=Rehmannia glutinosa TaxID=99300 RepID=A0ABR0W7R7_REHGL